MIYAIQWNVDGLGEEHGTNGAYRELPLDSASSKRNEDSEHRRTQGDLAGGCDGELPAVSKQRGSAPRTGVAVVIQQGIDIQF